MPAGFGPAGLFAGRVPAARLVAPVVVLCVALVLGVVVSPASPASAATSYPLSVVDDVGNRVVIRSVPQRVISLVPSLTEAVCAVGACGRLVGVDDFSNYPPQVRSLPRLGGVYDPNVERIVALRPDLVLLSKYGRLPETLRQAGITVFVFESETLDDALRNLTTVGLLLDRQSEAGQLVQRIRSDMERVASLVRSRESAPTVYYEIDPTPYAAGPTSFIGELIERAGGRNIVPAALGRFPRISPELIVAADPDVVILGDAPYGVTPQQVAARPGWAGLKAVKSGRVVPLDLEQVDLLSRPGPRVAEALRLLASILHPDLRDELTGS